VTGRLSCGISIVNTRAGFQQQFDDIGAAKRRGVHQCRRIGWPQRRSLND
jgi:hypothetical protein